MDPQDQNALKAEERMEKHAEIMRAMWRHENDLMNTRFNSFITIQALLFAGLGVALQNKLGTIVNIICLLGILVSFSTAMVFDMGFKAMQMLTDWWTTNLLSYSGPNITGNPIRFNNVEVSKLDKIKSFCTPSNLLPKAFFLAWLVLSCLLINFVYFFHAQV